MTTETARTPARRRPARGFRRFAAMLLAVCLLATGKTVPASAAAIFPSVTIAVDTALSGTEGRYVLDGVYSSTSWFIDKSRVTGDKVTFSLASNAEGIIGNTFLFDCSVLTDMAARGIRRVHVDTPAGTYTFAPTAFDTVNKGISNAIDVEQRKRMSMKFSMTKSSVDEAWLKDHTTTQKSLVTYGKDVFSLVLTTMYPTDVTEVDNISYMTHKWNATDLFDSLVVVGFPYVRPKYENTTMYRLTETGYERVPGLQNDATDLFRAALEHFSEYVPGNSTSKFTDLDQATWCKPYVATLYAAGVIADNEQNLFKPNGYISRAEFAKLIVLAIQLTPSTTYAKTEYLDVPEKSWFKGFAEMAAAYGLMFGAEGYFRPDAPITRQEIATIIYRAMKLRGRIPDGLSTASLSTYADGGRIASWAQNGMAAAVAADIMNGTATGGRTYLNPNGLATRAQSAAMILRYMEYYLYK